MKVDIFFLIAALFSILQPPNKPYNIYRLPLSIHALSKVEIVSNEKEDIFYKNHGIKLNNFTRPSRNLLTTMPKILEPICNAIDGRFGLLYENNEIRNASSASNKIIQNMCSILNSRVWRRYYITGQQTVQKLSKQIDE